VSVPEGARLLRVSGKQTRTTPNPPPPSSSNSPSAAVIERVHHRGNVGALVFLFHILLSDLAIPACVHSWQSCSPTLQDAPMSTMQWASEKPFTASYPSSPTSTMHPTYFAQQYASFAAPPPPAPTGTTNWQQGLQQADHRPPPLVRQNAFWR
jgi:hypothetical protein